jgi:hypothetical protein
MKRFMTLEEALSDPRLKQPWPDRYVELELRDSTVEELIHALDTARDERPLQKFLADHPDVLALEFPIHNCWVFPKPRLGGGKYIPDFLFCDRDSVGYNWTLIELESPKLRATTKAGSVSSGCHHAIEQICDYRRWLRDNAQFEAFQGFSGLNADCDALVIIGRQDGERTALGQERLAEFRKNHIEVASYDRLLTHARKYLQLAKKGSERANALRPKSVE